MSSRPQAVQPEAVRSSPRAESAAAPASSPLPIPMHLSELKTKHVSELVEVAVSNGIENASRMRKQDLIFALLKNQAKKGESIFGDGTLEVLPDGFGFLRSPDTSYLASTDDIYVSPSQIRRFNLHTKGRRALLRARQGRQGQQRGARGGQEQDPLREPDAAAPRRAVQARARHQGRGEPDRPRARHRRADRQGAARPDREPAQGRQ